MPLATRGAAEVRLSRAEFMLFLVQYPGFLSLGKLPVVSRKGNSTMFGEFSTKISVVTPATGILK